MESLATFQVYNASAGSGKTFTLVKEYLKIILQSEDVYKFQKILAVTFTNKAAGEMKERILENLKEFSEEQTNDLLAVIVKEIGINPIIVFKRSKKIIDAILQNYAAFSVTTIDSFTHKIIKNFAYDLGLSLNFEVEMDAVSLLNEAVDILISKIGSEKELTKLLIDFSLTKADDDKSWDISRELNEFARILLNEDDVAHFKSLANKEVSDFYELKTKIETVNTQIEEAFASIANQALNLIEQNGLQHSDFTYSGECPKHFIKLQNFKYLKATDIKFTGRLNTFFEEDKKFSAGKASAEAKLTIEGIYPQLKELYLESKLLFEKSIGIYICNKLVLRSLIPLAVLNNINTELTTIKEDNNLRLNAEFNQLISSHIKNQPTPFIYEKLGQRFMHYFIDEMQDTSVLQWDNLIPLIDNALAQEKSSLLLVGDGKQAIYRWRGGKAEQFINLGANGEQGVNPFHIPKEIKELETNYRSYAEVIQFNNSFFQHTAKFFKNESYSNLFVEGNKQLENSKKGGVVTLQFLEKQEDKEEEKHKYPKQVLETIKKIEKDFSLSEICVLTRKRKDGIAVANYLAENGVPIVSSETLLLQNSPKVVFVINLLRVLQYANDKEALLEVLYFLYDHLEVSTEDRHTFIATKINLSFQELLKALEEYQIFFDLNYYRQLPFYEKIEAIVRSFSLIKSSDAYLQFFLDVVLEQQRKGVSVLDFLEYWELKKEVLSIVASEGTDAVQIMTIHKSKGLEFPVVIFPYDLGIYKQVNPKVWLPNLPEPIYIGYNEMLVPYTNELALVSKLGEQLYEHQQEELELDNFNLLYVALTRAVEQLHVITEKKISTKGVVDTKYYSGVFIDFLQEQGLWNANELYYVFGNEERMSVPKTIENRTEYQNSFISSPWEKHNIKMLASASKLWDTEQGKAIEYGNLIHEMLSKIFYENDIAKVVKNYVEQGLITIQQKKEINKLLNQIVKHPKLKNYFLKDVEVYNEREIVDVDNQIIIPDRLVFTSKNKVVIIDYKTGKPSKAYHQQLLRYQNMLQNMGFVIQEKLLVYINEEILVEEV